MDSIWTESVKMPQFQTLEQDLKTDVLIIGGGIAGILCAFFLQQSGVDYVLLEGRTICSGITANTTAKLSVHHGLIYHKILQNMGAEKAALYFQANQEALGTYTNLCRDIACDYEPVTSYVYSLGNRRSVELEVAALHAIGQHCEFTQTTELPFPIAGAVVLEKQAQFHPLKFLSGIAENLHIYEHSFVKEMKENSVVTERGSVAFRKVIFATHFPIDNKHGMYFMKLYQHRSYVIALKNAQNVKGIYVDEAPKGMSFRNYKELLLVGGGAHRTGKSGGGWEELREFRRKYYPGAEEVASWATQDCMTLDGVPYIGQYSKNLPNCFVATGFEKWGMTTSMVAARLLRDMILEKESPYRELYDPSRSMISAQLWFNIFESAGNLLRYSPRRCPHLGCALRWNSAEHTWDCPCHGSRFDPEGKLLDNPSNGDLH